MLLHGIFPPITTPYYPEGEVYFKKLEHNVERYSKTPVAGIVVLGSTGEAVMLSDQERRDVLKVAREAAAPAKVLVAGTAAESAIETLRLTDYAAELGYDAALVRTPHYYKKQMEPANMLTFFRTIADRSALPVVLYSVPVFTGYDLPAEVVIELAGHPSIIGIKESGGDIDKIRRMVQGTGHVKRTATVTTTFDAVTPRMLEGAINGGAQNNDLVSIAANTQQSGSPERSVSRPSSAHTSESAPLKTRQKEVGFQILSGAAHKLLASLEAGAVGAIVAFADPAPTACYEIYTAWKEGDHTLAGQKQQRIVHAAERTVSQMGIASLKYAMDLNGYYGGPVRLPLLPLTGDQKAEVERLMADIRN